VSPQETEDACEPCDEEDMSASLKLNGLTLHGAMAWWKWVLLVVSVDMLLLLVGGPELFSVVLGLLPA